jgi:methylenetetrahydrofolate reductase (NADPH)
MKISAIYGNKKPAVSLEVFPPKKNGDIEEIFSALNELKSLNPDFISVTYSAAGSGPADITFNIASRLKKQYGIEALAHLTCIQSSAEEIDRCLIKLREEGIENIMALRGDLPDKSSAFRPHYIYAKDLIGYIKKRYPAFCVGAAAYPEGHIDADSFAQSLEHLKEKSAAGTDFLITQLFFDNRVFYHFYEKARAAGIGIPIAAGIMPILSKSQIERMIFMCGVSLPSAIIRILNKYEKDETGLIQAGIEYSNEQIRRLKDFGAEGIHIYTMNRPQIAKANMTAIGR